jgi:hypothetical protein
VPTLRGGTDRVTECRGYTSNNASGRGNPGRSSSISTLRYKTNGTGRMGPLQKARQVGGFLARGFRTAPDLVAGAARELVLRSSAVRKSMLDFGGCSCLALALLAVTAAQGAAQKAKKDNTTDQAIAVTAVELTKAYGDTTEGNKKYLDKTLIVEGKILSNTRIVGVVLILEGFKGPREKESRRVFCYLKPGAKASEFKVGETVKVQGTCKGQGISRTVGVDIRNCEVVK